jgi:hypothetical protein
MQQSYINALIAEFRNTNHEMIFRKQLCDVITPENPSLTNDIRNLPSNDELLEEMAKLFDLKLLYLGQQEGAGHEAHWHHYALNEKALTSEGTKIYDSNACPQRIITVGTDVECNVNMIGVTFNHVDSLRTLMDEQVLQVCLVQLDDGHYEAKFRRFRTVPHMVPITNDLLKVQRTGTNERPLLN